MKFLKLLVPPILVILFRRIFSGKEPVVSFSVAEQNRGEYWGNKADLLETWGQHHVWNEIQMFLYDKEGKVLDIACGTGSAMQRLSRNSNLQLYGIDNSPQLLEKCRAKGISSDRLFLQDVNSKLAYDDNFFNYSYSIGLMHYIQEGDVDRFVKENYRITGHTAYHNFLVSRSGHNENLVKTWQEYINNSVEWWMERFRKEFRNVQCIYSGWQDNDYHISDAVWIVCSKK